MSSPPRKRVRSSLEDISAISGMMIQEDVSSSKHSKPRSPSGDRRNKKAMKIQGSQRGSNSCNSSPGPKLSDDDSSETEGEFSPANSGVDPNFLRKIQKKTELSKLDQEVVRLIGQHLCDVGLRTSADVLMKEAGCRLDQPTAATFRHCVMKGDWTGAVNVLEDLSSHLENPNSQIEMKFILLEQKYLENLNSGNTIDALKVLQLELTPLHHNTTRTHELSTYLMLGQPPFTPHSSLSPRQTSSHYNPLSQSIPSSSYPNTPPDLVCSPSSRAAVMERLQAYLPPTIMLPPRRLSTLLGQAAKQQRDNCLYHNRLGDEGPPDSYAMDHNCSKEMFPSETIQVLAEHCDEVWFCKWSPNGRYLATGSKDYTVIIWEFDPETMTTRHSRVLEGHSYGVAYLAWSPDSAKLAVCGPDDCPEVWLWDVASGRLETKVSHSGEDSLTCVSWSPDGRRITCGGNRGQFYQCDTHGTVLDSWEGVRVQCLAYRQDGKHILAADTHHRLRSYNFEELSDQPQIQEDHAIMSFTTDQTDRFALLNIATQGLHMWDIRARALVRKFVGITQGFYTIHSCFGGLDQSFVASGSEDNKVYIFHVKRDEPIAVLSGHSRTVNCVSWNPVYHQVLVSASDDNTVRVWGPASQFRQTSVQSSCHHPHTLPSSSRTSFNNGAI